MNNKISIKEPEVSKILTQGVRVMRTLNFVFILMMVSAALLLVRAGFADSINLNYASGRYFALAPSFQMRPESLRPKSLTAESLNPESLLNKAAARSASISRTEVFRGEDRRHFKLAYAPVKQGSEKVYINDKRKYRGLHYNIDYASGLITFESVVPQESLIKVEYSPLAASSAVYMGVASSLNLKISGHTNIGLTYIPNVSGFAPLQQRNAKNEIHNGKDQYIYGLNIQDSVFNSLYLAVEERERRFGFNNSLTTNLTPNRNISTPQSNEKKNNLKNKIILSSPVLINTKTLKIAGNYQYIGMDFLTTKAFEELKKRADTREIDLDPNLVNRLINEAGIEKTGYDIAYNPSNAFGLTMNFSKMKNDRPGHEQFGLLRMTHNAKFDWQLSPSTKLWGYRNLLTQDSSKQGQRTDNKDEKLVLEHKFNDKTSGSLVSQILTNDTTNTRSGEHKGTVTKVQERHLNSNSIRNLALSYDEIIREVERQSLQKITHYASTWSLSPQLNLLRDYTRTETETFTRSGFMPQGIQEVTKYALNYRLNNGALFLSEYTRTDSDAYLLGRGMTRQMTSQVFHYQLSNFKLSPNTDLFADYTQTTQDKPNGRGITERQSIDDSFITKLTHRFLNGATLLGEYSRRSQDRPIIRGPDRQTAQDTLHFNLNSPVKLGKQSNLFADYKRSDLGKGNFETITEYKLDSTLLNASDRTLNLFAMQKNIHEKKQDNKGFLIAKGLDMNASLNNRLTLNATYRELSPTEGYKGVNPFAPVKQGEQPKVSPIAPSVEKGLNMTMRLSPSTTLNSSLSSRHSLGRRESTSTSYDLTHCGKNYDLKAQYMQQENFNKNTISRTAYFLNSQPSKELQLSGNYIIRDDATKKPVTIKGYTSTFALPNNLRLTYGYQENEEKMDEQKKQMIVNLFNRHLYQLSTPIARGKLSLAGTYQITEFPTNNLLEYLTGIQINGKPSQFEDLSLAYNFRRTETPNPKANLSQRAIKLTYNRILDEDHYLTFSGELSDERYPGAPKNNYQERFDLYFVTDF